MGPKERNLLKAAGKGDLEETARLVKDGANLSAINEDGESALTRAVSKKHIAVAKLLLDNGATTDYTGPLVHKPLHVAVQTGNTKLVQLLLDNGADVDELTARGSVLSQAITAGREDITSLLLSSDADINLARYPIQSPLGNAITRKNERLIKDLLKRGAETDVLLEHLYEVNAKQLSEPCQDLLSNWQAQKYEEQVQIIRSSSSDIAEKENALVAALKSASKHRQPEIHSMFVELAEEFNIAREKEYVYRS
jgi:ankyrin repeat protein